MKPVFVTLFVCTLYSINMGYAQEADSTEKATPQLKVSVNYNSHLNYYGRTDSLQSSGVFPMLEFWATPSFYINAAPIFINNAVQKMDYAGTVSTIGYQKATAKWFTHLYALKPFYTQSSQLVQAALKAQAGASVTRLNKVVNVTVGGDVKWSDRVDGGAMAGLDHIFRIEKKKNLVIIDPSVYVYAGTQQFSHTYTKKRNGSLLQQPAQQQVTAHVTRFSVLAYEFSVPIIFARGGWQVIANPTYVLPQNLLQVPNRPDLSEQGKNMFYSTLTVKRIF